MSVNICIAKLKANQIIQEHDVKTDTSISIISIISHR